MFSLKNKSDQRGFTIIELLIVIVVIGILAALVLTTYSGVQARARDSKRQTDIAALQSQLEIYYATNNSYPSFTNLNTDTWRAANMKGLSSDTLSDPSGTGTALENQTAAKGDNKYGYVPTGCDGSGDNCTGYTISAWLEAKDQAFSKSALNQ